MTIRPTALRRAWGALTLAFLALWPVATVLGWTQSVAFVSHLSVIALILACGAAWTSARAEVRADPDSPNP